MNAQAQMSGQLPGRVPNQSNQQMAGLPNQKGFALPPQMQSLAAHSIDRDLENHRERVRNSLVHLLQKRTNDPNADWVHKIPEFAKRLEDELYKYAHSKEDYMNMNTATMEQRLQCIVKNLPINGRPLPHHTPSSSLTSTMIPTPGMQHNANTSTVIACSADNPMITSGGSGVVQNPLSSGNLLPTVNGAPAVGHNPPFSASDGSVQNRYQQTPINMAHGSGGNNMIQSRQLSQMIPTPGLNNLQQISMISESPHGVGFSRIDSTMVSQQQHQQQQHQLHQQLHHFQQQQQHQQKQFVGSQNSRILHALGGQLVGGPRPNMQQKPSPYGFSNRVMNGGMGMIGNNVHMMNGPAASESYMNTSSGGSSNSLQQQFDQQHNLPRKKIHCPAQTDEITEVLAAFKKSYAEMKSLADRRDAQACELLDEVERLKKELEEAKADGAELAATLESQLQAKDAEIATITVDANSSLVDIVFKTRGQVMKDIKEGKYTQQQINDIAIDYDNLMAEEEDEGVTIDDAAGADGRSQGIPPNETPLVDGKETDVESDPGAAA